MIAKCLAVLAVVAQIYACDCVCGSGQQSIVLSGSGSEMAPVVLVSSGASGASFDGSSSSGSVTRNIVANGKYPVTLRNCGPNPDQRIPITTSRFSAPLQEKPLVRIPACIPAPKTISHSCTCYKTVLRPRVHQQIITVPTIERYLETSHKPVIENIQYEAAPLNCGSGVQFVQVGSGSGSCSSNAVQLVSVGSGSCGSQSVRIPVQSQQTQIISIPRSVEIPRVQIVEVPQVQTVQIPQPMSLGSCSCQC